MQAGSGPQCGQLNLVITTSSVSVMTLGNNILDVQGILVLGECPAKFMPSPGAPHCSHEYSPNGELQPMLRHKMRGICSATVPQYPTLFNSWLRHGDQYLFSYFKFILPTASGKETVLQPGQGSSSREQPSSSSSIRRLPVHWQTTAIA